MLVNWLYKTEFHNCQIILVNIANKNDFNGCIGYFNYFNRNYKSGNFHSKQIS